MQEPDLSGNQNICTSGFRMSYSVILGVANTHFHPDQSLYSLTYNGNAPLPPIPEEAGQLFMGPA